MLHVGGGRRSLVPYNPLRSITEARTLFAAMTTPPSNARKKIINTTILALKSAGIWSLLDVLYVTAAADSQAALLIWKNPGTFSLSAVNAPTFAADRGYTGDGATSRLASTWAPSTNGVNYTLNSASIWVWSRTAAQGGAVFDIGLVGGGAVGPQLAARNASDQAVGRLNDATNSVVTNTDGSGLIGLSRVDASTKRLWRNGAQIGADQAVASTAVGTAAIWMLGANATQFSTRQEAAGALGASLAGKELAFYNAMLAYMTAVGAA